MSTFSPEVYARRRAALLNKMQRGIALITAAPEAVRNGDAHYPYRQDSSFYYLTGFNEPEAALLLIAGDAAQAILFCREKNMEREIWDGHRYGPAGAQAVFGFDAAYPIAELDTKIVELMGDQPALYYALGANTELDARVLRWRASVQEKSRSGIRAPDALHDVRQLLNEMRLYKDASRTRSDAPCRHHLKRSTSARHALYPPRPLRIPSGSRTSARVLPARHTRSSLYQHRRGRRECLHPALCR